MPEQHVDVLIVGAGISGIGMGAHLKMECPGKTYLILERRRSIGGTWDLFRYPGIRSDSDMFTFGYGFRPWHETQILADGTSIREYVEATAAEYGVTDRIRFGIKVVKASFSTETARWTIDAIDEATGEQQRFTADFFMPCTGYYDYDNGYRPEFPNEDAFQGRIVHPQHWPEDLDYAGKKVVIIGSGATAVTLVPAMADTAGHITMLQRSPSYILSLPAEDKISAGMRKVLPKSVVYKLSRARNIGMQRAIYALAKARPNLVRSIVQKGAERSLKGAADIKHFTPKYDPWDQRLCIVPDGDLFRVIREGKADIVTDTIASFTETGIRLDSGETLDADIIVTATGLTVQLLGGTTVEVDGEPITPSQGATYKGVLLDGVPNAAIVFGYINASWTLKADLAAHYVCRLLNHMDEHGYTQVVARTTEADREEGSMLGALSSGYVKRGEAQLPRQGVAGPWRLTHSYLRDVPMLRRSPIDDGVLTFSRDRSDAANPTTRPRASA
ncbi:MAG TPA: NAD(P)/FAD-dependent oxidoreductase [Jatrophihabitans sp.]|jgi:cation diffusion facilitator CzcD-associated flavoprotein CzcO|uniref:flavin-containing monooxygenase n=1 Tax=Jatrophihabitans sp. TaxID=1932789 RepID=UPI002E092FA7|nr:NAD(P)/FAD-dependent oxidoreductase [Jatrophihabitans sp.]